MWKTSRSEPGNAGRIGVGKNPFKLKTGEIGSDGKGDLDGVIAFRTWEQAAPSRSGFPNRGAVAVRVDPLAADRDADRALDGRTGTDHGRRETQVRRMAAGTLRSRRSRERGTPGVADDPRLAAAIQDRCYGGGPGLACSRLHDDGCANPLRGQHGGIAEVAGAPQSPASRRWGLQPGSGSAAGTGTPTSPPIAASSSTRTPSRSRALLRVARIHAPVLTWRWARQRYEGLPIDSCKAIRFEVNNAVSYI